MQFQNISSHPSILNVKEKFKNNTTLFIFREVSVSDIEKEFHNLLTSKATQRSDIPTKILKENVDIYKEFICQDINKNIQTCKFPDNLKLADVIPVYKKGDRTLKENYRPVSILSNLSKIYKRCLFNQLSTFAEDVLLKYQCGFRKRYRAQICVIRMIKKWGKILEKKNYLVLLFLICQKYLSV